MLIAIIKKELLQLRRDPRLVGLIIVMPMVMLILFGVALKLEPQNVRMAYFDDDQSIFSNLIKTGLWGDGYFDLYEVNTQQQIVEEIRSGRAVEIIRGLLIKHTLFIDLLPAFSALLGFVFVFVFASLLKFKKTL